MKKRTLIFSLAYYPDFVGGAEVAIKEITDRIPPEEASFDMITAKLNRSQKRFEKVGNVSVYRVGLGLKTIDKFLIPFLGFLKATSLNRKNKYNILWCMMANQVSVAASFFKMFNRNIPLILTIQEGDEEEHLKRYVGGNNFLYKVLIRPWHIMVFRFADRGTVISEYLRKRTEKNGFGGPIHYVPNGVDIKNFTKKISPQKLRDLKKSLGFKAGDKIIITTSRLVKKNAVEDIISSLKYLPKKYKLLVLGSGSLLYKLQNLAEEIGVYDRVKFLGFVDRTLMPRYLKISNVFTRPSLSEGMGNSFIESFAARVPVVTTPVGGIVDFLEDGVTGLFCEVKNPKSLAERVMLLEKDKDLRESIILNAEKVARNNYNWNQIAKEMLKIIKITPKINRRIVIVTGDRGGPVTYSKILNERLIDYGFKAQVLSFGEIRHLSKFFGRIVFIAKLKKRSLFSDTVYAQDPVSVGFPAMLVSKFLRKRFVLKIVGDYAWEQGVQRFGVKDLLDDFSLKNNYGFKVGLFKKIQKFVANRANTVIVPSFYLKGIVLNWGVDANKINVVYNSFKKFDILEKEVLREKFDFGEQKIVISSGRLVPHKGFGGILEVISKIPGVKLIIAGDGPERKRLERKVGTLKLKDRVEFLGIIEHHKLFEYIRASNLFVLNSSYEGFSHLLLEAMSLGTPIVATNVGGNSELITTNKNGLLVENGNNKELLEAVNKVLLNNNLASEFSKKGLTRIKNFSEDIMLDKLIKIL